MNDLVCAGLAAVFLRRPASYLPYLPSCLVCLPQVHQASLALARMAKTESVVRQGVRVSQDQLVRGDPGVRLGFVTHRPAQAESRLSTWSVERSLQATETNETWQQSNTLLHLSLQWPGSRDCPKSRIRNGLCLNLGSKRDTEGKRDTPVEYCIDNYNVFMSLCTSEYSE